MKFILAALVFYSAVLEAQSSSSALFVPGKYTPLSRYQQKTNSNPSILSFQVKPQVVQYVINNNLPGWVAHKNTSGVVIYLSATTVNIVTGVVTLNTSLPGKYVVVAEPFTNDFPIVTQWNQALNNGKGGFQLGGTDPLGYVDFDPAQNSVKEDSFVTTSLDPNNLLAFDSQNFALFSDDPLNPNALVSGYERYIGENYSITSITDRMATYMSLLSVEQTGYPLIHRNYPWAYYDQAPQERRLQQSLPAFQMAHDMIISPQVDKSSLATFILPPGWVMNPAVKYAVTFNGFYDINHNTAVYNGSDFVKIIGDLINAGYGPSVGILWNGGGARGTASIHESAYLNAAYLFEVASIYAGIDKYKIVASGISRGGISALTVASNPYFDNYRVTYALAHCPAVKFGTHLNEWINASYPGMFQAQDWATGFRYAFKLDFIDPITGFNGVQSMLYDFFGNTSVANADSVSIDSTYFINSLKSKGTSVLLSVGTHDNSMPNHHAIDYYHNLKSAGVSVELDIGYRFGHVWYTDKNAEIFEAMRRTMTGSLTPYSGVKHFRRVGEEGADSMQAQEFIPANALAIELPKVVYKGNPASKAVVSGKPGLAYALMTQQIDSNAWINQTQVTLLGEARLEWANVLPSTADVAASLESMSSINSLAPGHYVYIVFYSTDGGANWILSDLSKVPQPSVPKAPVFEVKDGEPTDSSLMNFINLSTAGKGWGLAND